MLSVDAALDRARAARSGPGAARQTIRSRARTRCSNGSSAGATSTSAAADLVIEHDYAFPMVTHFAIEPHAFLAAPDANGVTIWSPTQHPYVLQRVVAAALQWPIARVRIIAPDPGGGFGGKGWPKFEPLMAWLALRLGRPVRLVLTLEETFQAARRTSARIHARTGFASDGRIVFQDIRGGLPARRVRRHRRACRQQGQLFGVRPVPRRARAHRRARAAVAHDAEHGVPRIRHAAGVVGGRIAAERSGRRRSASIRSRFAAATFRQRARRSSRTTRRRTATGTTALAKAAARDRLGRAARAESRPRHLARAEELVDRIAIGGDRAPALRRQRVGAVRHVRHGPGRAHGADADCRAGARRCARSHRDRDGRHRPSCRSTRRRRPADRPCSWATPSSRRATASRSSCGRWPRPIPARTTGMPTGRPAEGALRPAARRSHRHRRSAATRTSPAIRSAGAPRSGS